AVMEKDGRKFPSRAAAKAAASWPRLGARFDIEMDDFAQSIAQLTGPPQLLGAAQRCITEARSCARRARDAATETDAQSMTKMALEFLEAGETIERRVRNGLVAAPAQPAGPARDIAAPSPFATPPGMFKA